MLKFKILEDKDIKKIQKFTQKSRFLLCDMSAGVLYMWKAHYNPSYAVYNDTLIIKTVNKKGVQRFFVPIGKDENGAYLQIENYCVKNNIPLNFICVQEEEMKKLSEKYKGVKVTFNRDFSDYIYRYTDIETFVGKKFSGQRNHINAFKKTYPNYKFNVLTSKNVLMVEDFLKEYKKDHKNMKNIELKEYNNTIKLIKNFNVAKFVGGFLTVDGKIVAFSVGEYVGNALIIHIEKALLIYKGVYPTMFNEFVKHFKKEGIDYINREDDSGDLGLRTSKTQYQPVMIANKYHVEVETPFNVKKIEALKGKDIILNGLKKQDAKLYFKLYTQVKNNRYWGYNYKKDVKEVTPNCFYEMAKNDFKQKANAVYAIRKKGFKDLIGEVVLYNFSYDNTVEIGVRLFKNEQKKGYAKQSLKLITEYVTKKLNKTPVAKCYRQNEASKQLFISCGYKIVKEDKKFYYFNLI